MISEHHLAVRRTARYFTLGDFSAAVTEMWVVCHGYGQLAAPFLEAFAPIASPARIVIAPEALSRFYLDRTLGATDPPPRVGATWMTREDRDHEIADQVAYLDRLHDAACARLRIGPGAPATGSRVRLRVLGFSQGVATVGRWLTYSAVRVDELICWAGSFPPDVDLVALAARLGGAPITVVAGQHDELSTWTNAEVQVGRFRTAGIVARLVEFDGGHRLDNATLVRIADDPR